jgi:DNA-binding MarR family transcriptional regulator
VQKKCVLSGEIPLGAVISIINRAHQIILNDRLKPYGLTFGQFPVLMMLSHHQNITQDSLARHFRIDKGTIARAVKKLEAAGYVHRITDPDNRRAVRLFLTEKGEQIVPVIKKIEREWEEMTCAGISAEERTHAYALFRSLAMTSIEATRITGDPHHDGE